MLVRIPASLKALLAFKLISPQFPLLSTKTEAHLARLCSLWSCFLNAEARCFLVHSCASSRLKETRHLPQDGRTALHQAAMKGNEKGVCVLLRAGADIEAKTKLVRPIGRID
eukprot:3219685-Rhodomonas_salina.1